MRNAFAMQLLCGAQRGGRHDPEHIHVPAAFGGPLRLADVVCEGEVVAMSAQRKLMGIPTMYRGVRFRSRLEAKWAVMFDLLAWPWLYEPFDLDGTIPDFLLRFEATEVLVEVKPATSLEEMREPARKLDKSGWDGEALIVGATMLDLDCAQPILGWHRAASEAFCEWGEARLFWCLSCNRASLLAAWGSWHCRACGDGYGNEHVGLVEDPAGLWATSSNRVQWRPGA